MAEYQIKIPGISDIFKWEPPKPKPPEWARDMYQRARERVSPIPQPLRWIPQVINMIDDAQDLIFSAAYLARPLLKRLPARFIPYVGWGLLALDFTNLITGGLGMAMNPCGTKPEVLKTLSNYKHALKNPTSVFDNFVKGGGWRGLFSFVLQGAQALDTLIGRGLQIGPIMGTLSETWWAGVRDVFEGNVRVHVKLPPPGDIVGKAARWVSQMYQQVFARDILNSEEHQILLVANRIAVDILFSQGLSIDDSRANLMVNSPTPVYLPWREESIAGLRAEGVPMDETTKPFAMEDETPNTYWNAIVNAIDSYDEWSRAIRQALTTPERLAMWYMLHKESAEETIKTLTGIHWDDYTTYLYDQMVSAKLAECDFMVDPSVSASTLYALHTNVINDARTQGKEYPGCRDWVNAAIRKKIPWRQKKPLCMPVAGRGCIYGYVQRPVKGDPKHISVINYDAVVQLQGLNLVYGDKQGPIFTFAALFPGWYKVTFNVHDYKVYFIVAVTPGTYTYKTAVMETYEGYLLSGQPPVEVPYSDDDEKRYKRWLEGKLEWKVEYEVPEYPRR